MEKKLITAIEASGNAVVMSASEYRTMMLKHSLQLEGAKKKARELEKDNAMLVGVIKIMSGYLNDSLEAFEAMFESDEGCLSYETMADYVTIARFMGAYANRKHIADRVEEVMKQLPF